MGKVACFATCLGSCVPLAVKDLKQVRGDYGFASMSVGVASANAGTHIGHGLRRIVMFACSYSHHLSAQLPHRSCLAVSAPAPLCPSRCSLVWRSCNAFRASLPLQLSGGERSYTTVAFTLALGGQTDMPFRAMDEFVSGGLLFDVPASLILFWLLQLRADRHALPAMDEFVSAWCLSDLYGRACSCFSIN